MIRLHDTLDERGFAKIPIGEGMSVCLHHPSSIYYSGEEARFPLPHLLPAVWFLNSLHTHTQIGPYSK